MNIQKMLKQAQAMQDKLQTMQGELEKKETEGLSGGGMVKLTLNGKGNLLKLSIDDSVMDDKSMLEDLIIAAHNDAKAKIDEAFGDEMGKATSGMGLPPGMKLPF